MLAFSPILQPAVRPVAFDLYILVEDWSFEWREGGRFYRFEAYKGTLFDGASVPSYCYWVMQRAGLALGASLIHDLPFETRGKPHTTYTLFIDGKAVSADLSLEFTNDMFERVLIASNYPRWRKAAAVKMVRTFSPKLWERYPTIINAKLNAWDQIINQSERK